MPEKTNRDVEITLKLTDKGTENLNKFTKSVERNHKSFQDHAKGMGNFIKGLVKFAARMALLTLSFMRIRTMLKLFPQVGKAAILFTKRIASLIRRMAMMGGVVGLVGKGLIALGAALKALIVGALATVAAIAAIVAAIIAMLVWLKKSYDWYVRLERVTTELNYALIANRKGYVGASRALQQYARHLSDFSGYSRDAVITLMAMTQALDLNTKQTKQLTLATARFAAISGQDLRTTFSELAEAIQGNNQVLRRYGINLEGIEGEHARFNAILALSATRAGALEEKSKSLGAAWEDLKTSIVDLGKEFIPILKAIGVVLTLFLKGLAAIFKAWAKIFKILKENKPLLYLLPGIGMAFAVADILKGLGVLGKSESEAAAATEDATGRMTEAWRRYSKVMNEYLYIIIEGSKALKESMKRMLEGISQQSRNDDWRRLWKDLRKSMFDDEDIERLNKFVKAYESAMYVIQGKKDTKPLKSALFEDPDWGGTKGLELLSQVYEKKLASLKKLRDEIADTIESLRKKGITPQSIEELEQGRGGAAGKDKEFRKGVQALRGLLQEYAKVDDRMRGIANLLDLIYKKYDKQKHIHESILGALEMEIEKRKEILRFAGALSREEQLQVKWLQEMQRSGKLTAEVWERIPQAMRALALATPGLAGKLTSPGGVVEDWAKKRGIVQGDVLKGKEMTVKVDPVTLAVEVSFEDPVVDSTVKKLREKVRTISDDIARQVLLRLKHEKGIGQRTMRFKIEEAS